MSEQGNIAAATAGRATAPAPAYALPAEVSIVVPTFNEQANIAPLIEKLEAAMAGFAWEVVFVDDDSTDGTVEALRAAAARDPRVRFLHRLGRRGLSSAVVEGVQSTSAPLVAVMDADMQHDERLLPRMVRELADPSIELVVGSRYIEGGGTGDWAEERQRISRAATALSRLILKARLTDPMSGFFMIRREAFDRSARRLSAQGYKILLDILASAQTPLRYRELPYVFGQRAHGESKLDLLVTWEYVALLIDKSVGRYVPSRFVMFSLVGGAGVFVHMAVLATVYRLLGAPFDFAQAAATFVAMTFNFFVNNALTYRDRRRKGLVGLAKGLLSFYAIGAVGAVANVGVASFLFVQRYSWFSAGLLGILIGAVWNYAASAAFTWRGK
jgi:dolichol-phosphate mannosyltransferase